MINPKILGLGNPSRPYYTPPLPSKAEQHLRPQVSGFDSIIKGIQSALSCCKRKEAEEAGHVNKQIIMEVFCDHLRVAPLCSRRGYPIYGDTLLAAQPMLQPRFG